MKRWALFLAAILVSTPATAADICRATVLLNIPKNDDSYAATRGDRLEAVTQYVKRGSKYLYCSHGGGCYSAFVVSNGKRVPEIKLDNCYVDLAHPDLSYDEIIYPVEVDRRRNSSASLRYEDVDNRLLELGMCSACASNAAYVYIHDPKSSCGQVVRLALEGNPSAKRRLQGDAGSLCNARFRP